MIKRI
jgi:hypothetical protein